MTVIWKSQRLTPRGNVTYQAKPATVIERSSGRISLVFMGRERRLLRPLTEARARTSQTFQTRGHRREVLP
jgi:hypothetical protein